MYIQPLAVSAKPTFCIKALYVRALNRRVMETSMEK